MSTTALSEEAAPALSEGQRLLYTFISPSRTMADLRRNTSWWVPWLLISIFSIGFAYTVERRIGWGQVIETASEASPNAAGRMERVPQHLQETVARAEAYGAPVENLLFLVAVAAVLMGVFNFGLGTKLEFSKLIAVSAYGFLPSALNKLLMIVFLLIADPEHVDIQNPLATNIGFFVPASAPFLRALLEVFDIFTIWQVFLIALGISQLSKVKKGTAVATVFGIFFVCYLLLAAATSL